MDIFPQGRLGTLHLTFIVVLTHCIQAGSTITIYTMSLPRITTKVTIGGGLSTALSSLWSFYSHATTAAQLPADATTIAKLLADPPAYLPYFVLAISAAYLAYSIWPTRVPKTDTVTPPTTQIPPRALPSSSPAPKPDIRVEEIGERVLGRLPKRSGTQSHMTSHDLVNREIKDIVSLNTIQVWGRQKGRPIHPIPLTDWDSGALNFADGTLTVTIYNQVAVFESIMFLSTEVERHWPIHQHLLAEPSRTWI